jgi:hypothetical protein
MMALRRRLGKSSGIRWFPDGFLAYDSRMATKKKKTAARKSTPAKKKMPAKALPKKAAAPKVSTKATSVPQGREHKLAEQALKLVDQAASVLRSGIRDGAKTTAQSRIAAKKKANDLLGKASSNLNSAISSSTSALQSLIGKI